MWTSHKIDKFLYDSQRRQLGLDSKSINNEDEPVLGKNRKEALNKAVYECIIRDGRSFLDFKKPGKLNKFPGIMNLLFLY